MSAKYLLIWCLGAFLNLGSVNGFDFANKVIEINEKIKNELKSFEGLVKGMIKDNTV